MDFTKRRESIIVESGRKPDSFSPEKRLSAFAMGWWKNVSLKVSSSCDSGVGWRSFPLLATSSFLRWHLPWQCICGFALFTQNTFSIPAWWSLKFKTSIVLLMELRNTMLAVNMDMTLLTSAKIALKPDFKHDFAQELRT